MKTDDDETELMNQLKLLKKRKLVKLEPTDMGEDELATEARNDLQDASFHGSPTGKRTRFDTSKSTTSTTTTRHTSTRKISKPSNLALLRLNSPNPKLARSPAIPFIPLTQQQFDPIPMDTFNDNELNRSNEKENDEQANVSIKAEPQRVKKTKQWRLEQLEKDLCQVLGSDDDSSSEDEYDFNESDTEKKQRKEASKLKAIENTTENSSAKKKTIRGLSRLNLDDSNSEAEPNIEEVSFSRTSKKTATPIVAGEAPSDQSPKKKVVAEKEPPREKQTKQAPKKQTSKTSLVKATTSAAALKDDNFSSDEENEQRSVSSRPQKRIPWSPEEALYLVIGVKMHGKGNWSKILERFKKKFNDRNGVQLKDKYRNLEKNPEELRILEKTADVRMKAKANKSKNDSD